jgi:hypothetical protein
MDPETTALRNRLYQSNKRAQKSCGPCRARKVRCNRDSPCVRCIKSGYPNLCIYDRRGTTSGPCPPDPSFRRSDRVFTSASLDEITRDTGALHPRTSTAADHQSAPGENQNDKQPYLGANSLAQFLEDGNTVIASSEGTTRQGAREAMMPMLGALAPPVPGYPFYVPSEGLEKGAIARLCRSLPSGKDIIR